MALICPTEKCKAVPGMCRHEKILGVVVLVLAALFALRR